MKGWEGGRREGKVDSLQGKEGECGVRKAHQATSASLLLAWRTGCANL